MTRGEKIVAFIETFCLIPEAAKVGQPIKLMDFQKKFIPDLFDNPNGTSRACFSVARKNWVNRCHRTCAPGRPGNKAKQPDHFWCAFKGSG